MSVLGACAQVKSADTPMDQGSMLDGSTGMTKHDASQPSSCDELDCDDQNECTEDSCENGKCSHAPLAATCSDDGDACTDDVCSGALCTHPSNASCTCAGPADCDDKNPCTDDACGPHKVCAYTNNQAACPDDGNVCTSDVCSAGACTHPDNGTCECMAAGDCDDQNPCTDDTCSAAGKCEHANNTAACTDDGTSCTNDVCADGLCTHADNKTCECLTPAACDDENPCTDDSCSGQGKCVHTNNTAPCASDDNQCTCDICSAGACTHPSVEMCITATALVLDSFDSSADWDANVSTPAHLTVTGKASFDNTNLENNAVLYLAESGTGSLEISVPNLAGLKSISLEIQSNQADTVSMVKLGVFDTAHDTWVDKVLTAYGSISQGSFGTLTVPFSDFSVTPCAISKVRLSFSVSGGQKEWRLQGITAK
jgi:hypothetical protein